MKNLLYIQSGGPTTVLNSCLYGAFKEAQLHKEIDKFYGSINGIAGLIDDKLIDLGLEDAREIDLLLQTPGAALGTTRRKFPKDIHDPIYKKITDTLVKHDIKYILLNGGNDSMETCHKISTLCEEMNLDIKVLGLPKTIDNDLSCTDHSVGYGSAAKSVINILCSIVKDARSSKRGKVFIIEVMGRNAGWLAAASDLVPGDCHPDLIYLPEVPFFVDEFLDDIKRVHDEKGSVIAIVSEGIKFEEEIKNVRYDNFGNPILRGAASTLAEIVEDRLDVLTRPVELSLMQRANPFIISRTDRDEAVEVGRFAVRSILKGETGKMIVIKRLSDLPYKIEFGFTPLILVSNVEKCVPEDMILDRSRMSDKFRSYCLPLIQGEVRLNYKDGIVELTNFKKHLI